MIRLLQTPMVAIGLLVMIVGSVLLAPQGAAAATVGVTGEVVGGATFQGVVVDAEFIAYEEALVFEGTLEGVVTIDGEETEIVQVFAEFAVVSESSNCKTIFYTVDPIMVEEIGADVVLHEIAMERPRTGLLGGLLGGDVDCLVRELLGDGNTNGLADLLNDLLGN